MFVMMHIGGEWPETWSPERKVSNMVARISMVFMALVVAVALFGFVQAPVASAAIWHHTYKGQVVSYDRTANTLIVAGKDGQRSFDLSKATVNGQLRPNENVVVKYDKKNGEMLASSVDIAKARMGAQANMDKRGYGSVEAGSGGVMTQGDNPSSPGPDPGTVR